MHKEASMLGDNWAIGVDLGGTKIEIGLVDVLGSVHHKVRLSTQKEKGAYFITNQIIDVIQDLKKQVKGKVVGVGVGVAGQINPITGIVMFAPNLNWHHVPLQTDLSAAIEIPVTVVNDVRAITWGEWLYGAGRECENFICLFIGTGIGSGIVSSGHLLTGCNNTAGEVGHMTIETNGLLCTCGNRGCFEAYAGGWAIGQQAREAILNDKEAGAYLLSLVAGKIEDISARTVIEAARADNPLAKHLLEKVKHALIVGCTNLINAFNPCRLILGGGILEGLSEWILQIEEGITQRALKAATQSFQVVPAKLQQDAGVIGGAAFVRHILTHSKERKVL